MTLPPDTELGTYRIERLLGRGGMGEVYLARDAALERRVALKVLPAELAGDDAFRRRFLAESKLAASLDHPHIVPVYEAGERDGRLVLVMRYVEGEDLGALLAREGALPAARAVGLLRGIADALDAAHDRGLVHRDVKPSNILVARTGRGDEHAYLADFGLVKQLGSSVEFTAPGGFLGSVGYVAPEQIEGRPVDGRADTYSLACVLYQTLTGRAPFAGERDVATLWAHLQAERPRPSGYDPSLARFDPVIARGMAVDPGQRHPSAGELLADAAGALGGAKPTVEPARARGRGPARSKPLLAALAIAIPALLVAFTVGDRFRNLGASPSPSGSTVAGSPSPSSDPPSSASGTASASPESEVTLVSVPEEAYEPMDLPPGRYRLEQFRPRTEFEIHEPGWRATEELPDGFTLEREDPADQTLSALITGGVIQVVFTEPCLGSPTETIVLDPKSIVDWLSDHEWLTATNVRSASVGGWTGLTVDVEQARDPQCTPPDNLPQPAQERVRTAVYLFQFAENTFWLGPEEKARVIVVDVDGRPVTIIADVVRVDFDKYIEFTLPVIDSMTFDPEQ